MDGSTGNLSVEYVAIGDLKPYSQNARTHSDHQIKQIAASMREFGFTNPILIAEDREIIAGHGRLEAAKLIEATQVPTITIRNLSDAQRKALVLSDNQLSANAGWDKDILKDELQAINALGFEMPTIGFDDDFLKQMLHEPGEGQTDPDAVPDLPEKPWVSLGDIFALGGHRLMCGDCTSAEAVTALLDGQEPHLMVTDPPWGVEYDPMWRAEAFDVKVANSGEVQNDDRADWTEAWKLFPGDVAYVWHGDKALVEVAQSLQNAGFEIRNQIIWEKGHNVISRGNYNVNHEPCLYGVRITTTHETAQYAVRKAKATAHWAGDATASTVWKIPLDKVKTGHGTQKPIDCMRKPIVNNSLPSDAVYDPFCGSGTTLIAAEMEKRRCFALEVDPGYCQVILDRWQAFTGQQWEKL